MRNMAESERDQCAQRVGATSHASHLSSGLNNLRHQGTFCDVTIIVGGQRFPAHKAVLSSASSYFTGMFSSGFQESTMSEVGVRGTAEVFAQILEFMYTGYFTLSVRTVVGILEMACYIVLTEAVKLCAEYLKKVKDQLTYEDSFEVWSIADNHSISDIAVIYRRRVVKNFLECVQSRVFLENSSVEIMADILGDEEIEADAITEEQILEGSLVWLKYDWEERKVYTIDLLRKIRIGLVPVDRLNEILGEELLSIPECKDMVAQVVHLIDTMDMSSPLLMKSHPDLFASRNTITGFVYADKDVEVGSMISIMCSTETRCFKLTQMADIPSIYPYEETDILAYSIGICVTDAGHLYAGGGKDILLDPSSHNWNQDRIFANWDWLSENNFYRYDHEKNKWITLPPQENARFEMLMFQENECIYSFGFPAREIGVNHMVAEKYSFAEKKWEVISRGLGFRVTSIAKVNGYMLIKGYTNEDHSYEITIKVVLYKIAEGKFFNVASNTDLDEDSSFSDLNNIIYLVRGSGDLHRVNCNFAGKKPSIAIADEEVNDADIIKAIKEERPFGVEEFTFDKRRLGMMPTACTCPSHNIRPL